MLNKLIVNTAVLLLALLGVSCFPSLAETPANSIGNDPETKPSTSPQENPNSPLDAIRRARDVCNTNVDKNRPVAIPIGTNSPIAINRMRDKGQLRDSNYDGVGYVSTDGQAKSITIYDICSVLSTAESNGGQVNDITYSKNNEIESANSTPRLTQRRRVPTIDLIVRNRQTNNYYSSPK